MPAEQARADEVLSQLIDQLEKKQKSLEVALETLRFLKQNSGKLEPEFVIDTARAVATRHVSPVFDLAARHRYFASIRDDAAVEVTAAPASGTKKKPVFDRIVDFFLANDNTPATNETIRDAIGSNRGTVAVVIFNSHPDKFEKVDGYVKNKTAWRLYPWFFEKAKK